MIAFNRKELTTASTAGERLKKQRLDKNLDLTEVAQKINIIERHLAALENNDWDGLPGEIYIKRFLQIYCEFLNLNFDEIYKQCEHERKISQLANKINLSAFIAKQNQKAVHWYSFITFKLIRNLALTLLVAAGLAFLGHKINNIVAPPKLIITEPKNNTLTIQGNYIEIAGQTETNVKISINGQSIMINPDGNFKEGIHLQSGLNIIKISASKQYGKTMDVYREVMVER